MCARMLALFACVVAVSAAPAVSPKKAFLGLKASDVVVSLMTDIAGVHGKDDGKEAAESEEAKAEAEEDAEQEAEEDAEQEAEEDAEQQAEQEAEGAEEDSVSLITADGNDDAKEAAEEEEANAGAEEDEEQEAEEDEEQDEEEQAGTPRTAAQKAALRGARARARAKPENKALRAIWVKMKHRHAVSRQQLRTALARYKRVTTKRYACVTDAHAHHLVEKTIARQSRMAVRALNRKCDKEDTLYFRRSKCMRGIPGDQSVNPNNHPRFVACMKRVAAQEKAPEDEYQGLTLYEKVAVKKQTDRFQQILDQTDLFSSEQAYDEFSRVCSEISESEQKQMQDTWDKDNKKLLQQCEQPTPP